MQLTIFFTTMISETTIRVASRPSKLAMTQSQQVIDLLRLENPTVDFELIPFKTEGDRDYKSKLTDFGGIGVFVKELEIALLENKADIAIHSLKDVPSLQPDELELVSFPHRETPNDILLARNNTPLAELPSGFVVGTGSPRRIAQIKSMRQDAVFKEIRGNIDTRLEKLENGEYDAILLAVAGLNRLGKEYEPFLSLDLDHFVPAVGQGALAIECRKSDAQSIEIARSINHDKTEISVRAEREFMRVLEGGCKLPLAAYAHVFHGHLYFNGLIGDIETGQCLRRNQVFDPEFAIESAGALAESMKAEASSLGIKL